MERVITDCYYQKKLVTDQLEVLVFESFEEILAAPIAVQNKALEDLRRQMITDAKNACRNTAREADSTKPSALRKRRGAIVSRLETAVKKADQNQIAAVLSELNDFDEEFPNVRKF